MPDSRHVAIGDISGDGDPEIAVAGICNRGWIVWPQWILIYTPFGDLVGGINLGPVAGRGDTALVTRLGYAGGSFNVQWRATQGSEPICCPTLAVNRRVRVTAGAIEMSAWALGELDRGGATG